LIVVSTTEALRHSHARRARHRKPFALDVDRYCAITQNGNRSRSAKLRLWLLNRDFRIVACFRFGQATRRAYARSRLVGLVPVVLGILWRRRVAKVNHAMIDRQAQIGPGLLVMHGLGLFIGPVSVGANCVLHQNVTIGQRVAAGDQGVPTLGDNVWIGPGSTLSGDITIGHDVTISAGTVLSKSVPDGSLVAGNPGRVIQRDYDNRPIMGFLVPGTREARVEPRDS
jgi:serine acetyltransferase